jgi:hypothetical protein
MRGAFLARPLNVDFDAAKPVRCYSPDISELAAANHPVDVRPGRAGSSRKWDSEEIAVKVFLRERLDGNVGIALAPAIAEVATGVPADPRIHDGRDRRLHRQVGCMRKPEAQAQRSAGEHGKFGAIHEFPLKYSEATDAQ